MYMKEDVVSVYKRCMYVHVCKRMVCMYVNNKLRTYMYVNNKLRTYAWMYMEEDGMYVCVYISYVWMDGYILKRMSCMYVCI